MNLTEEKQGAMAASHSDSHRIAIFCDFAQMATEGINADDNGFDVMSVLAYLSHSGRIVIKKAYCDWARYHNARDMLHQAHFDLIDVGLPHSDSAAGVSPLRLALDALEVCYTRAHIDTFVILTGVAALAPLVLKLRENNKTVIGVAGRASASTALIDQCDAFIFYEDIFAPSAVEPSSSISQPHRVSKPVQAELSACRPEAEVVSLADATDSTCLADQRSVIRSKTGKKKRHPRATQLLLI